MTHAPAVIIIGSGLAGYTLAREFRKQDQTTPLTIITNDDGSFYSKPMLSSALSQGKQASQLVTSSAQEMSEKLAATILNHTKVNEIDSTQHMINTSKGDFRYRSLILATGAIPFRPPINGNAADDLLSINNLDDYTHFRERLESAQHVAIIGPGLIGCEFANDLLHANKTITIIGPDSYPLSGLLPKAVGLALQQALEQAGVNWQLGTTATAVNHHDKGFQITLDNSTEINADLVISAVGLRPDIALAQQAGITVNRGIVTNELLVTSVSDIYALGDCAEVNGTNLPFVAPLMTGARALAKTLTGNQTLVKYPAMPVIIKTSACPLVVLPPPSDSEGEWSIKTDGRNISARFIGSNSELLGFALSGEAITEKQALLKAL